MALNSGGGSGGGAGGIEAGRAFVTLFVKNKLGKGLNDAAKQLNDFGKWVGGVGAKLAAAGAAGGVGLGVMAGALNDLAKQGAVADALGLTAEQFTGIAGVAKSAGEDTREFIESLVTLGKLGTDAANGTEQASQAFANMGLNANDFIKLRADEQFFQVFDALNKMTDPLQRTRALMMGFGEDGGKFLLPLLGKSSAELRKMAAGFAVSGKDMAAATEASLAYSAAGAEIGKAWNAVSIAAAPLVKEIAGGVAAGAGSLKNFIQDNREVVLGLGLAVGGLTAVGLGMMALGPAISALSLGWTAFTAVFSAGSAVITAAEFAIAAPIVALPAALVAAGVAWLSFTTEGRGHLSAFSKAINDEFGATWQNLRSGWSVAMADVARGDFAGAFSVAFATVGLEWTRVCIGFEKSWSESVGNMQRVFERFRLVVNTALDKPAAGVEGAVNVGPGKQKDAGIGDSRRWLPAFAKALDILQRKALGDEKVDKQKAEQWKLDNNLKGLAQDIDRIANEGKDERDAEFKKRLQAAQDDADAAKLGGLMRGGLGWLRGQGKAIAGDFDAAAGLFGNNAIIGQAKDLATRGTFGADASKEFFGMGKVSPVVDKLKEGNAIAEEQKKILARMEEKMIAGLLWGQ